MFLADAPQGASPEVPMPDQILSDGCGFIAPHSGAAAEGGAEGLEHVVPHQPIQTVFSAVPGLTLFESIIDQDMQAQLVELVERTLAAGRRKELPGKTYVPIPPNFAPRGQSREMLQFGVYVHSNRVETDVEVAPLPPLLEKLLDTLEAHGVFTPEGRPDTCAINVYQPGQWLPPHFDNPAFLHPFATVSLVSAQDVLFGRNLTHSCPRLSPMEVSQDDDTGSEQAQALPEERTDQEHPQASDSAGTAPPLFEGIDLRLAMPIGSCLRLDGAAASEHKHAVPPPSGRRISITVRRLSEASGERRAEAMSKKAAKKAAKVAAKVAHKEQKRAAKAAAKLERRLKEDGPLLLLTDGSAKSAPIPTHLLPADGAEQPSSFRIPELEKEHVKNVYDSIAAQWHGTRHSAWPRVLDWMAHRPPNSLIADVGCGNGKNLPAANAVGMALGSDISIELVKIAAHQGQAGADGASSDAQTGSEQGAEEGRGTVEEAEASAPTCEVAVADCMMLPYRSGCFDAALCIAVLHHISTEARRIRALAECLRVVRVGGEVLVYAWAYEQTAPTIGGVNAAKSGHRFTTQDVLVPFHARVEGKSKGVRGKEGAAGAEDERARQPGGSGQPKHDGPALEDAETPEDDQKKAVELLSSAAAGHGVLEEAKRAVVFQRYCHVYAQGELEALFQKLGQCVEVVDSYWDSGNWAVVARKLSHPL